MDYEGFYGGKIPAVVVKVGGRSPSRSTERGQTHLAPDQHGTKDDLETVEEVVPNDDDGSAPCGPALTGADGFDAGSCSWKKRRRRERHRTSINNTVTTTTTTTETELTVTALEKLTWLFNT